MAEVKIVQTSINYIRREIMNSRRAFLKNLMLVGAGLLMGSRPLFAEASDDLDDFPGIIYTKENPGKWAGKVSSHLPEVTVKGRRVTITNHHAMNKRHFIVRHTLVSKKGEVLGEKVFQPSDKEAVSTFKLPFFSGSKFYATSFCNKHDLWVVKFKK